MLFTVQEYTNKPTIKRNVVNRDLLISFVSTGCSRYCISCLMLNFVSILTLLRFVQSKVKAEIVWFQLQTLVLDRHKWRLLKTVGVNMPLPH